MLHVFVRICTYTLHYIVSIWYEYACIAVYVRINTPSNFTYRLYVQIRTNVHILHNIRAYTYKIRHNILSNTDKNHFSVYSCIVCICKYLQVYDSICKIVPECMSMYILVYTYIYTSIYVKNTVKIYQIHQSGYVRICKYMPVHASIRKYMASSQYLHVCICT